MIISKSERYFILFILIIGVCLIAISYYQKTSSNAEIRKIEFEGPHLLININTATRAQLEKLPGIGPVLAQNIVSYRDGHGRFKSIEELKNVKGIGDKKFEMISNSSAVVKRLF